MAESITEYIDKITYKAISAMTFEWVEGQPFLASLGQIGLTIPTDVTNVFMSSEDFTCKAIDFYCMKIFPETLCSPTGIYVDCGELNSENKLLFENDIIEFELNEKQYKGFIANACGMYAVLEDTDSADYICALADLTEANKNYNTIKGKIVGNLYDGFESETVVPLLNYKKRDFAQMLHNLGGSKYTS